MKYILMIAIGLLSINKILSQWQEIPDFQVYCNTAVLADSNSIWGGGHHGKLFHYDISNQTFEYKQLDEKLDFYALYPLNDSTLLLGGWDDYSSLSGFFISYRWDIDSIIVSSIHPYPIMDIELISSDTGFMASMSGIHRTVDSGVHWELIWEFDTIGALWGELNSLTIDTLGGIYAAGLKRQDIEGSNFQGFILKSSNRGSSWEVVFEYPDDNLLAIDYRHETVYCCNQDRAVVFVSEDFGDTWNILDIPCFFDPEHTSAATLIHRDHIITCITQEIFPLSAETGHSLPMIVDSPNGGQTWYKQYENNPLSPSGGIKYTFVNVNDTLLFLFGGSHALMTDNQGGFSNPGLYIKDIKARNNVNIYPMPATDHIFIEGVSNVDRYSIHTLSGITIDSKPINHEEKIRIPLTALKSGAYIIKFYNNNTTTCSQLVLKH